MNIATGLLDNVSQKIAEQALALALPGYENVRRGPARLGAPLAAPVQGQRPVVLVPGFANNARYLEVLQRSLEQDGFRVFTFDDPHLGIGSVDAASRGLAGVVDAAKAATGAAKVDVVTYSAGVSVARAYASLHGGAANIDKLVALDGSWRGDDDSHLLNPLNRMWLGGIVPTAFYDLQRTSALNQALAKVPNGGIPGGVRVTSIFPGAARDADIVPGADNVQISDRIDHMDLPRTSDEAYEAIRAALCK